jgi:outer membrane protein W
MAPYHFHAGSYKPYLGAGINYTRFSNLNIGGPTLEKTAGVPRYKSVLTFPSAQTCTSKHALQY